MNPMNWSIELQWECKSGYLAIAPIPLRFIYWRVWILYLDLSQSTLFCYIYTTIKVQRNLDPHPPSLFAPLWRRRRLPDRTAPALI